MQDSEVTVAMLDTGEDVSDRMRSGRCEVATPLKKACSWSAVIATLATVLGLVTGYVLHKGSEDVPWTRRQIMYLTFPGELLLRMQTLLFVPLKVSCLIGAVGSTSYKVGARLMRWAFFYIVASAALSTVVGFTTAMLVRPGRFATVLPRRDNVTSLPHAINYSAVFTVNILLDMMRDMFPPNIVQAAVETWSAVREISHGDENVTSWPVAPVRHHGDGRNTTISGASNGLGLMSFSLALGFVLAHAADDRNVMLNFFINLSNILISLWRIFLWYLPIGVFFLSVTNVLAYRNMNLDDAALYVMTVCIALFVQTFFVLPLLYRIFVRRRSAVHFFGSTYFPLLFTAVSSSGIATLPVTIWNLERHAGLDPRVVRFVAPLGVNINTNGMTVFLAVSALYLMQLYDLQLNFYDFLCIGLGTVVASIAESGVPGANTGPVYLAGYIVGMPAEDSAVLFTALVIVERLCAITNVTGDCVGAAICQELVQDDLLAVDEASEEK